MGIQTALMSTVQDETDVGPGEQSIGLESESHSYHEDGAYSEQHPRGMGTSPEAEEYEVEEQVMKPNGNVPRGHKDIKQVQQVDDTLFDDGADILNSSVPQRPSSADGSLSAPDDTPSIQVLLFQILGVILC